MATRSGTSARRLGGDHTTAFETICDSIVITSKKMWSLLTVQEASGSCGDLGNLLPLLVALSRQRAIYATPTLFVTGISHIFIGGCVWQDVPVPLQPMTAISAVAVAGELTRNQVITAGVWMGLFLLILRITGGISYISRIVPISVVSGLQIGVGLRVAVKGISMISSLGWWPEGGWHGGQDCVLLALVCGVLCMYWLKGPSQMVGNDQIEEGHTIEQEEEGGNEEGNVGAEVRGESSESFCARISTKHPVGLYLFAIGAVFAAMKILSNAGQPGSSDAPSSNKRSVNTSDHLLVNALRNTTWDDWKNGLLEGAIPQLPLTTLNSVISVCALANSMYARVHQQDAPNDRIDPRTECEDLSDVQQAASPANTANLLNNTDDINEEGRPDEEDSTDDGGDVVDKDDVVLSEHAVCLSVGVFNILACPLGCLPHCHGAGGLAGQHRLGARSGASMVLLGFIKACVAVFVPSPALLQAFDSIPVAVLGILLLVAGHELAVTGMSVLSKTYYSSRHGHISEETALRQPVSIALLTTAVIIGTHKTHYGVVCGWLAHMIYGNGWRVACGRGVDNHSLRYTRVASSGE